MARSFEVLLSPARAARLKAKTQPHPRLARPEGLS